MSTQGDSQSPAARALFEQLSQTASSLNTASDLLNKRVEQLESALQRFNLGISCWEEFASSDEERFPLWVSEQIGYSKLKDRWRICLRKKSGHETYPEQDEETTWPFPDAPREMRVRASHHFPKLIAKLNEEAKATEQKLSASTAEIERLTTAIDTFFAAKDTPPASGKAMEPPPHLTDNLRNAVTQALHEKGHETASALLSGGRWTFNYDSIMVSVDVKKTMLSLTMNQEAQRIARTALQQAGSNAKLMVQTFYTPKPPGPPPSNRVSLRPSTFEEAE